MDLKKMFGFGAPKPSPETRDAARERQNQWIKAQMREWQLAWHALFDADPGQPTADNAAKGDGIPDDLNTDYRLIFGFCEVTVETRAACLALLPQGPELTRRFESFYSSRNVTISAEEAMKLATQMREKIKDCTVNFEGDWGHIVVVEKDDKSAIDALDLEGDIHQIFEPSGLEPHPEDKLAELAAAIFLTEPLYAAAGNWYQPAHWLEGLYREPAQDACLELVYQLWLGGWDIEVGGKGIALVQRQVF